MKKIVILSIVAVLVMSMGVVSFAAADVEAPEWFDDMITWKKEQIKEAVDNDTITEEQATLWNERLDYMKEYHEENGFAFPGGCMGGGARGGFGRGARGFGNGGAGFGGYGPGMMWNNNVVPSQVQ